MFLSQSSPQSSPLLADEAEISLAMHYALLIQHNNLLALVVNFNLVFSRIGVLPSFRIQDDRGKLAIVGCGDALPSPRQHVSETMDGACRATPLEATQVNSRSTRTAKQKAKFQTNLVDGRHLLAHSSSSHCTTHHM